MSERTGVEVVSINFRPEGLVEVSYAEQREQNKKVAVYRTMIVDGEDFEEQVEDLRDSALALIDAGDRVRRDLPTD